MRGRKRHRKKRWTQMLARNNGVRPTAMEVQYGSPPYSWDKPRPGYEDYSGTLVYWSGHRAFCGTPSLTPRAQSRKRSAP